MKFEEMVEVSDRMAYAIGTYVKHQDKFYVHPQYKNTEHKVGDVSLFDISMGLESSGIRILFAFAGFPNSHFARMEFYHFLTSRVPLSISGTTTREVDKVNFTATGIGFVAHMARGSVISVVYENKPYYKGSIVIMNCNKALEDRACDVFINHKPAISVSKQYACSEDIIELDGNYWISESLSEVESLLRNNSKQFGDLLIAEITINDITLNEAEYILRFCGIDCSNSTLEWALRDMVLNCRVSKFEKEDIERFDLHISHDKTGAMCVKAPLSTLHRFSVNFCVTEPGKLKIMRIL